MLDKLKRIYKDLKDSETIDRKTVEQINTQCDNIISDIIPSNAFTSLKTTTNFKEVVAIIENEIYELKEQKAKGDLNTVTKDLKAVDEFISTIDDLKTKLIIDTLKITSIYEERRLTTYTDTEPKILVDLLDEYYIDVLTNYVDVFKDFSNDATVLTLIERFKTTVEKLEAPTLFIGDPKLRDVINSIRYSDIDKTLVRIKDRLYDKLIKDPYEFELSVKEEWLLNIPKNKANLQVYTLLLTILKQDKT